MKVGIYTNLAKDIGFEVTGALVKLLKKYGADFYLFRTAAIHFPGENSFDETDYLKLELMITVGGDGTVLNIAQDCLKADIPMLPVNKGTKGFLNEIELTELHRVIDVIEGRYRVDKRILIEVSLKGKTYLALNEAFIARSGVGKMISLVAMIDGLPVDKYFCDGLLVCTPTGSTAYSLSAGGPIITPGASVMCMTPVSSHCLHSRPIVIGDHEEIEIKLATDYDDAMLTVDGTAVDPINADDVIIVKKAAKNLRFFRLPESSFYSRLLDKLNGLA